MNKNGSKIHDFDVTFSIRKILTLDEAFKVDHAYFGGHPVRPIYQKCRNQISFLLGVCKYQIYLPKVVEASIKI